MIYTFTVPMLPPASGSLNSRVHWRVRHRERVEFMEVCALAILGAGGKVWRFKRIRLSVEILVRQMRRHDTDNAIASLKGLPDTLVQMGILPDDSSEYLEWGSIQWTTDAPRAPATIVQIEERG